MSSEAATAAPHPISHARTRAEYMRGEGFAFYTGVNAKMLSAISRTAIPPVTRDNIYFHRVVHHYDTYARFLDGWTGSAASMFMVANTAGDNAALHWDNDKFCARFGIRDEDLQVTERFATFENGLADRVFPWKFTPFVANSVAYTFAKEERITSEQLQSATLSDWGDLISSGWFRKLIHGMAFASNGFWGEKGTVVWHYEEGRLKDHINSQGRLRIEKVFEISEQQHPRKKETYPVARLSSEARDAMRQKMWEEGSVGCPVARLRARLPQDMVETNPHVAALVENGTFKVGADRQGGKLEVQQDLTAIDRTLLLIARQLRRYQRKHGQPVLTPRQLKGRGIRLQLEHQQVQPNGLFAVAAVR